MGELTRKFECNPPHNQLEQLAQNAERARVVWRYAVARYPQDNGFSQQHETVIITDGPQHRSFGIRPIIKTVHPLVREAEQETRKTRAALDKLKGEQQHHSS